MNTELLSGMLSHLAPLVSIALLVLAGVGLFSLGRDRSGWSFWFVLGFSLMSVLALALELVALDLAALPHRTIQMAWTGLGADISELYLGVTFESTGLLLSMGLLLIGLYTTAYYLFNGVLKIQDQWTLPPAFMVSIAAVMISTLSSSIWAVVLGIAFSMLSGIIYLAPQWTREDEGATWGSRFFRADILSFLCVCVGASILVKSGVSLDWGNTQNEAWSLGARVGAVILLFGLFVLFRPFPMLAGTLRGKPSVLEIGMIPLFFSKMMVAFAALYKIYPVISSLQINHWLYWCALVGSGLACIVALLQRDWRLSVPLCMSSLLLYGWASTVVYAGEVTSYFVFAIAAMVWVLFSLSARLESRVFRYPLLIIALIGNTLLLSQTLHQEAVYEYFFVTALLLAMTAAGWHIFEDNKSASSEWKPGLTLVVAFATIVVLVIFGIRETGIQLSLDENAAMSLAMLVGAGATTYWLKGNINRWHKSSNRIFLWASKGFSTDEALRKVARRFQMACALGLDYVDRVLWCIVLGALKKAMNGLGRYIFGLEKLLGKVASGSVAWAGGRLLLLPLKIQNGNIQWYIFFGLMALGMMVMISVYWK